MKAIWKYELSPVGCIVDMPDKAQILSAAFQSEDLMIWARVDTDQPVVKRSFSIAGTGWHLAADELGIFVGTAFHPDGLVFHVFDQGYIR